MKPKPPVPMWRWATWYTALGAALVLFYGLVHPVLVRPARARLGGGVPRATAAQRRIDSRPMADRYVYDFEEPVAGGRDLLGGKGIGLAEMTLMGVPVPAGFTITTDASRAAMAAGGELPAGLEQEVDEHVRRLEERTGKRFGATTIRCSSRCARAPPSRCPG